MRYAKILSVLILALLCGCRKETSPASTVVSDRARELGANAVVGIDIDYETLGADNGMLMATASGTAVVID